MIKSNWNIFKAKFSDNPQSNFEWLCYILFCKEFKQDKGIFRYKNQSAIETEPIKVGEEVIGWQAKFYETSLSNHKKELIETLEKAKKYYPDITKIIFYTNQEWGQSKGQKPEGLIEIEKKAKELNVNVKFRTASFFESPFVSEENKMIAKHFFTFDKSIFDLIEEQQKHTENILKLIRVTFNFKNQEFEANRNNILEKLENADSQVIILSGAAGVGKTAVIKKYYYLRGKIPFYVFKASEFNNLRSINEFFKNFDFYEFIEAHKNEQDKIIVIDSAEKLLDLNNTDPFKEFLQIILKNRWKIIFTTRDNYVDILNTDFTEIYGILPENINIQNLSSEELIELSEKYKFNLPNDEKLFELIKNPFYLNEYLNHYKENEILDYVGFKNKLWNQIVSTSKPLREQCFLQIAFERANSGQFYITPSCESSILDELYNSGILGYESPHGYFITHDIYEEWALEKIIEREFLRNTSVEDFLNSIGESLPIRRSLRNWLSEKLLLDDENIKQFIENALTLNIPNFWKDEILISILLSDYAESFFKVFETDLLKNNQALLKKLTFLLRLACKEVDNDFLKQIGVKNVNIFSLKYVLTKPKGKGWKSLIKFVFNNLEIIGIENISFILPVIYDWNTKFKKGETTRYASLLALKYYQWIIKEDVYFYDNEAKSKLLQTILYGTSEIKNELKKIFEEILKNKWKYHKYPYYDLVKIILVPNLENGFAGIGVAKALPEYVLKLADLFWTYTPKKDNPFYSSSSIGTEKYFNLEETHSEYFPSSGYQTPLYWLLQFSPKETIDFILEFTNKSVRYYANSGFDSSVKKIKAYFDNETIMEQYISHCLWNMYRGTSSPVSPDLLQSIHMALEKYFLEIGKEIDSKTLENWLIYLLKNSESASISAVIASIVLAYPDKTFNVAKILFKTKEFILQDKTRVILEYETKSLYSIGYGLNYSYNFYQDERIKTCDDKHRKWSLEELFLYYQTFRNEEISENEVKRRQQELWKILDYYYNQLPDKDKETEKDKTWKLFLARMDKRKMKIKTEIVDKKIAIQFEPEIEPELKKYSEKSLAEVSKFTKYISLKLWANYKIKGDNRYKKYEQYEKNPKLALKEVKEIINELKNSKSYEFHLFNYPIPAEVCSTLVKFHINELSKEEKEFCKDIILEVASLPLKADYQYQISDGVESALSVLPILFKEFPEERDTVKTILLLTLFDPHSIGMYAEFADFPTKAIKELFSISFEDAQSLLFGYLYLKPKYESLRNYLLQESYGKGAYQLEEYKVIKLFIEKHKFDIKRVINNEINYEDLNEIEEIDLYILERAFQLIPEKINNELNKKIAKRIINAFIPKSLSNDRENRIDYKVKHKFLEKYAYFVLNLPQEEIHEYLKPFIDNFNASETVADLFEQFIYAEDVLNKYDNFWTIWESFKEKVFEICKEAKEYWYVDKIIKSYLFATVLWNENAKEWHSFKISNKMFFKEISQKIGHCPSTLYALAKLLNGVGSLYIDNGIIWISNIIKNNKNISKQKLETNTIYYLESLVRKFIYKNREDIKKRKDLKERILIILDFLVKEGSVVGFLLRKRIL